MSRERVYRIDGRAYTARRSGADGVEVRADGETFWTRYVGDGLYEGRRLSLHKAAWIHHLYETSGRSRGNPKKR